MDFNVAFVIFNRPETTRQVFEQIRRARPGRLFAIADGPRAGVPSDVERCAETRRIVDEGVDWDCEVLKNYAESNLTCRYRPASGFDWVFQHVGHCIILEDDCVPHPSFFPYCQELLERFYDDERVMAISGDNFQEGPARTAYSYYFSDIVHIWGWATWKRAWDKYNVEIPVWPEIKNGGWMRDLFADPRVIEYWTLGLDSVYRGFNGWDLQFLLACWIHRGLCVLPSVNLISNIGFGENATHTARSNASANRPTAELEFPLVHPPYMIRDARADRYTFEHYYKESLLSRMCRRAANNPDNVVYPILRRAWHFMRRRSKPGGLLS